MVSQRDVVEISFPNSVGGKHPAIVLSNNLVHEIEFGSFICVMLTQKNIDDEFSFVIKDDMLTNPQKNSHCEARCQLIMFVNESDIIPKPYSNQIKIDAFKNLITHINSSTLSVEDLS